MSGVRIADHLLRRGGQRHGDQDHHAREQSCLHVPVPPSAPHRAAATRAPHARPRPAFHAASAVHQNAGSPPEFRASVGPGATLLSRTFEGPRNGPCEGEGRACNRELSSTGLACIGPQPARRGGAAHGGMPDGPVACPRRRGFRAADPAYGRATRPGRPLGARRRGAGADARRASGSRLRRPAPRQARAADQPQHHHRTGARSQVPAPRAAQGRHPAQRPGILPDRAPQPGAQLQPPVRDCAELIRCWCAGARPRRNRFPSGAPR